MRLEGYLEGKIEINGILVELRLSKGTLSLRLKKGFLGVLRYAGLGRFLPKGSRLRLFGVDLPLGALIQISTS